MLDLIFLLFLSAWSAGVGLWILRRLGHHVEHTADSLALALPLGLGSLGMATLLLGEVGLLSPGSIVAVLVAGSALAAHALRSVHFPGTESGWGPASDPGGITQDRGLEARPQPPENAGRVGQHCHPDLPDLVLGICVVTGLLGTLLTALAPVTDGDALCYHLLVSRRILERGGLFFDPDLHESVYPLLTELLYTVALALRGPVACRLVQWLLGVSFALGTTALARPFLGRRAWWAGSIALLVPAVSNGMSAPLNDVALAAFSTAAMVAWMQFRSRPGFRNVLLLGVLTGLALSVKYPALVLAFLIGLTITPQLLTRPLQRRLARGIGLPQRFWMGGTRAGSRWLDLFSTPDDPFTRPRRRRLRHVLVFCVAASMVGGVWYARALWYTGNPVHPFFRKAFGGAGLDEVLAPEKRPLQVTAWNLVRALGPMTLEPDRFDSLSHQFGPIFLLFLPALLLERPPRRVLRITALGYGFLILCLTQRQSMRFVLTALGPLSVAVAWLAHQWWERRSRPATLLVAVLLLVVGGESLVAVARARHGIRVVLGLESAEQYLARREPTYQVGKWVDSHLATDVHILGQDHRGFYIPRSYTMELAHRRRTGLGLDGESAETLVDTLRREGFTHLLLCPPEPENAVEFDGTLSRRLSPWIRRQRPIYRDDLVDADGVVRHYALYEIRATPAQAATIPPQADPDIARASSERAVR